MNQFCYFDNFKEFQEKVSYQNDKICIYVNSLFFVVVKSSSKFCMNCFEERLKINKEFNGLFAVSIEKCFVSNYEKNILEYLVISSLDLNQVSLVDRTNFESITIHVTPMDYCESCIKRNMEVPKYKYNFSNSLRGKTEFDLKELVKTVDRYSGLFKIQFINANSNYIPMVGTVLYFHEYHNELVGGFGRDSNLNNSKLISILEGLERYYTSSNKEKKDYRYFSYVELNNSPLKHLSHKEFESFLGKKVDINKCMSWVKAKNAYSKEEVLLPRQIIEYFDENSEFLKERVFFNTSSGSSLGSTIEEAILFGLFELIERDAFLVYWHGRLKPRMVELSSILDNDIQRLLGIITLEGYEIRIFDITTEIGIPVFWTYITGTKEHQFSTFTAAGSHLNFRDALRASLVECISSLGVYSNMYYDDTEIKYREELAKDYSKVSEMDDHFKLYAHPEMKNQFSFVNDCKVIVYDDLVQEYDNNLEMLKENSIELLLDAVIKKFKQYYGELYYYNFESTYLRNIGLYAVRVFSPNLLPMTFGSDNQIFSRDRISRFVNYKNCQWDGKLNKLPHPFP